MEFLSLGRLALSISAVSVLLAGCGAVGQSEQFPSALQAGRPTSLSPQSLQGDLLYLPGGCSSTCIVSYPGGQVVGSAGPGTYGACGDGRGNVFIADNDAIDEYSHGGTEPINTFSLPGFVRSCGVDPQTGNLAVAFYTSSSEENVAIFSRRTGAACVL